jgi:uncharacterized protein
MKRLLLLLLLLFLFTIPVISAQKTGHITLLAVSEATGEGSVADMYLKMQDGRGGVYIETAPLTKLDTQLSTRFAQQIGCDFVEKACNNKDFFYTIRSDATIIGGPSAGAAIAAMTVAMLDNHKINESVTVTGTINAGGLIGSVSGISGKIEAAEEAGVTKVLIPKGTRYEVLEENATVEMSIPYHRYNNETNMTEIDTILYGETLGIEVIEITTLQEAVYHITGKWYEADDSTIVPEMWYTTTMESIATNLCKRNRELVAKLDDVNWTNITIKTQLDESIINSTRRAENATAYDMNYVAASTCFSSNILLNYEIRTRDSNDKLQTTIIALNLTLMEIEERVASQELTTITDLQTYLVVNARLQEARETLEEIEKMLDIEQTENLAYNVAYAEERLYSASSWALFFSNDGKELILDHNALQTSCNRKIAEAQERYQYIKLYTIEPLEKISGYLTLAYDAVEVQNFIVCLDMASKAKANIDIIMSLSGIQKEEEIVELVEDRLRATRQVLNKQQELGLFPMLGFSYYEYADFLKEKDPYSALIYAQYALEFSNLDMYFEEKEPTWILVVDTENLLYFGVGVLFGVIVCCVFSLRKKN